MPPILAETFALFVSKHEEGLWQLIESNIDRVAFSFNGTYAFLHCYHDSMEVSQVLELACPYLKNEYCFIVKEEAEQLILDSLTLKPRPPIKFVLSTPEFRRDYEESKDNW